MLSGMRKGLGRYGAAIILAPLILAFAIWGIGDIFKGGTSDSVATVNGQGVSARDFENGFERAVKGMQARAQQQGQTFTKDDARKRGLDRAYLDDMMTSVALEQAAKKAGFKISDAALAKQIRELPAFQDGLKRFNKENFLRVLADANYTQAAFEKELRGDMVKSQLGAAAGSGAQVPLSFLVQDLKLRSESRSVRYVRVPGSSIPLPPQPTDAEIKKFYDEQGGQIYAVPEYRTATLVLLSPKAFAAKVTVPEADVTKVVEQNRDKLTSPEKRTFQQLPAPSPEIAAQIAARAQKGEKLTAIGAALKLGAPIVYTNKAKTEIGDAKIADAAFAAKPGAVIGPIAGSLGASSVLMVDSVTPPAVLDEAKARQQIHDELAEDQAKDLLFKTLEQMEDSISGGATLEKAAQAAGLSAMTYEPIDRQGMTARKEPIEALVPEKIRASLFSIGQGEQSDADTLEDGTYFIVRNDKVKMADKLALEQVKPDVAKRLFVQKRIELIEKEANAFADAANNQVGLNKAAAAKGLKVIARDKPLHRGEQDPIFNPNVTNAIFGAALNQTIVGPEPDGGFIAAQVDTITREDPRANPELLAKIQASTVGRFGNEIAQTYQAALMSRAKLKVDQKRFDALNGRTGEAEE